MPPEGTGDDVRLLAGQLRYYRRRAAEYDEWFERRGRYDQGPALRRRWQAEADSVRAALRAFGPSGDVLELAGGTGIWTVELAQTARRLHVVDGAAEMLAINRERVAREVPAMVDAYEAEEADIFGWSPPRRYDVVFFGFWLSHVPAPRFDAFWELVRRALAPGGRVFFIDSRRAPEAIPPGHALPADRSAIAVRRLNDGSAHHVIKHFYEPSALVTRLDGLGFDADVKATDTFFIYGSATAR